MKKVRLFGLVSAILMVIATFLPWFGFSSSMSMSVGFISAALAVGIACIAAGIAVGHVGSAAMGALAEKPEISGRALIFVGLAEGIAIYGLIVAIMILGKLV